MHFCAVTTVPTKDDISLSSHCTLQKDKFSLSVINIDVDLGGEGEVTLAELLRESPSP